MQSANRTPGVTNLTACMVLSSEAYSHLQFNIVFSISINGFATAADGILIGVAGLGPP